MTLPMTVPVGTASAIAAFERNQETRLPKNMLDQDDFLKLVVAQLSNQDPLKPQTDTEFLAQMTQFTTLEQTKNMQTDIAQMRAQQQVLQGMSLMDREVIVRTGELTTTTGVVGGLEMEASGLKVIVNGRVYALDDILGVRLDNPNQIQT